MSPLVEHAREARWPGVAQPARKPGGGHSHSHCIDINIDTISIDNKAARTGTGIDSYRTCHLKSLRSLQPAAGRK